MENAKFKSGFATLIGRPNVGKSTLMNHLIGQKIAITSNKPQTTRNRIQTVYTDKNGQIVFLDTPGIHKAKNKLGEYMVNVAEHTLKEVDVVLWLVEPTDYIGAGEKHIVEQLEKANVPVILIMNKIDQADKTKLPKYMEAYRQLYHFQEVIPVCALRGVNMDKVIQAIFRYLPYGPKFYEDDTVTDQPQRQIVAEMIREKALRCLDEEIPHGIAVSIERMEERKLKRPVSNQEEAASIRIHIPPENQGYIMDIDATIICEKDSHKGIIIGKGGAMLRRIGSQARVEAERMLEKKVNLKLWVKVKKDWRDSDFLIKNFGYDKKEI